MTLLAETMEKAWRDRRGESALDPVMAFGPGGLTLGAGTVLAPVGDADDSRMIVLDEETEARLSALLSAAYVRVVSPQTLRFIRCGAVSWRKGDKAMAAMHLAMTGLPRLQNPEAAARRLFMADMLMKAGAEPDVILRALDLAPPIEKSVAAYLFEPRNLLGEWAQAAEGAVASAGEAVAGAVARAAVLYATRSAMTGLALLLDDAVGATVVFGVLLIPFNQTSPQDSYGVPGHPDMRLQRGVGERLWRFVYTDKSGVQCTVLEGADGKFRDRNGQVVGSLVHNKGSEKGVAIYLPAVGAKIKEDEPELCPAAQPDKPGGGSDSSGRKYEDFIKPIVNPERPTPPGFGVVLPNPAFPAGETFFDDCQHSTGNMFEAKYGYASFIDKDGKSYSKKIQENFLDQSKRQVLAARNRQIIWFFSENEPKTTYEIYLKKRERAEKKL